MLEVKDYQHNIIEAIAHDKVTKTDMEKLTKLYEEKTKKEEQINLLLTLEDVDGITIEGLIKDIKMASFLKSIEKVDLIGNKTWLKVDAKIESIEPSIKLRQFDLNEKNQDINWLEY